MGWDRNDEGWSDQGRCALSIIVVDHSAEVNRPASVDGILLDTRYWSHSLCILSVVCVCVVHAILV